MKLPNIFKKKSDLVIVNRSFWPKSQVLGEALLQFAELSSQDKTVSVITQEKDLEKHLKESNRGAGLKVYGAKAYTTSSSSLPKRIIESVYFTLWTAKSLVEARPKLVYVSTNPPVVVPFIVALYCQATRADYVYHLQDIHPEAANIVVPLNKLLFHTLKAIDNYTIRHAKLIITLSEEMKEYIEERSKTTPEVHILDNPSFDVVAISKDHQDKDIIFCGNAGRFQRIPLLIDAIDKYIASGGKLSFTFAGNGLYAPAIQALSNKLEKVEYLGFIPGTQAAEQVRRHKWSLLPIDDEVTKFAFPSKSSAYALSGSSILAICGADTSVAKWVNNNKVGLVCNPDIESLVQCFFKIEDLNREQFKLSSAMQSKLKIQHFAKKLKSLTFD